MKANLTLRRNIVASLVAASVAILPVLGSAQAGITRNLSQLSDVVAHSSVSAFHQHRYREDEWRRSHPHWNGHYYYHGGGYYYDSHYSTPAVIDNEWGNIAIGNRGVSISVGDPYLYFNGSYGSWYPAAQVDIDLHGSNSAARARAGYFSRPYFYRQGVRYDRVVGTHNGVRSYRFVRHPR